MERIAIEDGGYDAVEVDLWGTVYRTKPLTRSLVQKADPLQKKLEEADDTDDLIAAVGAMFDLRLVAANGKRTKPSTLIARAWQEENVTLPRLLAFMEEITDADRPT